MDCCCDSRKTGGKDRDMAQRSKDKPAPDAAVGNLSGGFMANPEMKGADEPLTEGKLDNGTLWFKFADGRVKHVMINGDVNITHSEGDIENYCKCRRHLARRN
jgi:hypothetical protein